MMCVVERNGGEIRRVGGQIGVLNHVARGELCWEANFWVKMWRKCNGTTGGRVSRQKAARGKSLEVEGCPGWWEDNKQTRGAVVEGPTGRGEEDQVKYGTGGQAMWDHVGHFVSYCEGDGYPLEFWEEWHGLIYIWMHLLWLWSGE